eukprot:TRINITY_DN544_c1_g1_i4.p1 TRINITY_DN544_c1_g1~~TRINITY_DN544_c1_g1_i4.p1  ORF type:complete len:477 (-),score=104.15 TRINITY_DN544_c1_g1_i4:44-1474(-)
MNKDAPRGFLAKDLLLERKATLEAMQRSSASPHEGSPTLTNKSASSPLLRIPGAPSSESSPVLPGGRSPRGNLADEDREMISVLDRFLADKKDETNERLAKEEAAWDEVEERIPDVEAEEQAASGEVEELESTDKGKERATLMPLLNTIVPQMKWKVRIFAVVNRLSGKGKKADVEEVLRREGGFRWKWEIFYIKTGKEDMAAAVKQKVIAERGFDWVFACGGDGTVSSLVSLLSGTGIPIGVIPLGTGNAFAQEMKIPLNWKHAVQMISRNHVRRNLIARPVDVMEVGTRYCMLTIDIGIGAKTVEDAANHAGMKRRLGVWAYLISATKAMAHQARQTYQVNVDGEIQEMVATEVVLCNAGMVGVGHDIRWGPDIKVDDGKIDIVFIEADSVADYVSVIKALGTGSAQNNSRVKYLHAYDFIEISSNEEAPVAADGDVLGTLPLRVKVVKGAVNVLLPKVETPGQVPLPGPVADK